MDRILPSASSKVLPSSSRVLPSATAFQPTAVDVSKTPDKKDIPASWASYAESQAGSTGPSSDTKSLMGELGGIEPIPFGFDPITGGIMVLSGGAAGAAWVGRGVIAGAARALPAAITTAVATPPIFTASEEVGKKHPKTGFLISVVGTVAAGQLGEKAFYVAVSKVLGTKATPQVIEQTMAALETGKAGSIVPHVESELKSMAQLAQESVVPAAGPVATSSAQKLTRPITELAQESVLPTKPGFLKTAEDLLQAKVNTGIVPSLPTRTMPSAAATATAPVGTTIAPGATGVSSVAQILPRTWGQKLKIGAVRFWWPFSQLTNTETYQLARFDLKGHDMKAERIVARLATRFGKLDQDTRLKMFQFMAGRLPMDALPVDAAVRQQARAGRTIMDTLGQKLVNAGMLKQEVYESNKGNFIPYLIGKHYFGEDADHLITPFGKINWDFAKARVATMTYEQRQALGLIEDMSVAFPIGVGRAVASLGTNAFQQKAAGMTGMILDDTINIPGLGIRSFAQLDSEITALRTSQTAVSQGMSGGSTLLDQHLAKLEGAMRSLKTKIQTADPNFDYKQMPNSRAFGPMAGKFVRKEVKDDLVPLHFSSNDHPTWQAIEQIMNKGVAYFKVLHTAANLPTVVANTISNPIQNNLRGRPLGLILGKDIPDAMSSWGAKDPIWLKFREKGGMGTNWGRGEMADVLNSYVGARAGNSLWAYAKWYGRGMDSLLAGMGNKYGKIDDFFKYTIYRQMTKNGADHAEAMLTAQKYGMDYSEAAPFIKKVRKNFVPFATYAYKIAPLVAESIRTNPLIVAKYHSIPILSAAAAIESSGMTEAEWDTLRQQLPEYAQRHATYMVLPTKNDQGDWAWNDYSRFLPWGGWLRAGEDLVSYDPIGAAKDIAGLNPYLDLAVSFLGRTPIDTMTGQPIYNKEMDKGTAKQLTKTLEYMVNKWFPSMLQGYHTIWDESAAPKGALGYTVKAIRGDQKLGRNVTELQAIGRWAGVNIEYFSDTKKAIEIKGMFNTLNSEFRRRMFNINSMSDGNAKDQAVVRVQQDFVNAKNRIFNTQPGFIEDSLKAILHPLFQEEQK